MEVARPPKFQAGESEPRRAEATVSPPPDRYRSFGR